jgi:hypothetical protein
MTDPAERTVGQGQAEDGRLRLEPDSAFAELNPTPADEGRAMTAQSPLPSAAQRLSPRRPPGRCNRKARTFSAEIRRLHAEGYSFAAIREALAEAGVVVSISTVQREAARGTSPAGSAPAADTSP